MITIYLVHTNSGDHYVWADSKEEAIEIATSKGYYVHYCDDITIKKCELFNFYPY